MTGPRKRILIITRQLLRIILSIETFVMLDMFYTIIYPERYYIFEVNYIFISLYILTAAAITYITIKLKDFFIYKVKFKSDVFMKVVYFTPIIIYLSRFIIIISETMANSYGKWGRPYGKFPLGDIMSLYMVIYICIMIDYFCIRSIIRNIPVCYKIITNK